MLFVTRALVVLVIAISGAVAIPTQTSTQTPPTSAAKKHNAAIPAIKAAPAAFVGGVVFIGANLAMGL
ncbi:hypothetical protein RSOLAG22IIIB_01978 [Rhizoctonia solani]|uniref:Uncharacterized protein n=1 Tax=Rhizoctonia solani TaxID=456999 RepID=A0A0K6GC91_9AGAM|nr:hypothetical protein RSOLAG22IIIB_01978 [Rhizoctonia solani]